VKPFLKISLLLFIISLSGCYSSKECLCPDLWAPVCGANGVDYANPCSADCDDVPYTEGECPVYGIGEVKISSDSLCGFIIEIFNEKYHPYDLADKFKQVGLIVTLRYRKMHDFSFCDDRDYQRIKILEIDELK